MRLYCYSGCGTCKKAKKWLEAKGVEYTEIPIRDKPPTKKELKQMLGYIKDIKKLFNTSSKDYREMAIKEKLPKMSDADVFELLSTHGNLIKRPFVLVEGDGTVGFDETRWAKKFLA